MGENVESSPRCDSTIDLACSAFARDRSTFFLAFVRSEGEPTWELERIASCNLSCTVIALSWLPSSLCQDSRAARSACEDKGESGHEVAQMDDPRSVSKRH